MMTTSPILPFVPQEISAVPIEVKPLSESDFARGLPMHGHLFFEVLVISGGSGTVMLNGKLLLASQGSVFVIPPCVPHDVSALGDATGWALLFLPRSVERAAEPSGLSLLEINDSDRSFEHLHGLDASGRSLVLNDSSLARVEELFRRMHLELRHRDYGYESVVRASLQLILVEISRGIRMGGTQEAGEAGPQHGALIQRVFADIDQHFNREPSLTKAARRVGLSAGHLTTRLRRLTGRTYGEWVLERRMMMARHRLAYSDQSVSEIADSLGYESPESFIRRFRAHHATTPKRWRDRARQKIAAKDAI